MDNNEIENRLALIACIVTVILVAVLAIAYKLKVFWWQ
tara:strand:- start:46585 stop:46698 length:114 start_codon:yes stop_codon:yes gene_type:complete